MARQRHKFWVNPTLSHPLLSLSSSPRLAVATLLWFVWTLTLNRIAPCGSVIQIRRVLPRRSGQLMLAQLDHFDCAPAVCLLLPSFIFIFIHIFGRCQIHMFIDHNFPFNREHSQLSTLFFVIPSKEQFPPSHSLCTRQPLEHLLV